MPLLPRFLSKPIITGGLDQEFLDRAAAPDGTRHARYALYEEYYTGHDLGTRGAQPRLTERAKQYLQRSGLPFNENFCEPLIDVFAERLTVSGFTAEDQDVGESAAEEDAKTPALLDLESEIESWWGRGRMDDKQHTVHTTAVLKGDAFLIVDWDADREMPRFSFNRPECIPHCVYDDEDPDKILWASKVWNTSAVSFSNPDGRAITRLNVYFPDRVERYMRVAKEAAGSKGGWARFSQDAEAWPVPWVRADGTPLGVPVFHFRYRCLGHDYGRSELHSALPFQDELNKAVIDLNEVLDYHGWPIVVTTGVDPATATEYKPQPGAMLNAMSAMAKFDQLPAADPTGPLAAIEGVLSRMARRSRTPMHLLTGGTPPSGEALKTSEAGLVSKVKAAQTPFGSVWEDALMLGVRLAVENATLAGIDEPNLVLQTDWADAETRNDLGEAQRAQILDEIGVSKHTILTELGYDPEQEAEWKAREDEAAMEAAGRMLDAGGALPQAAQDAQPAAAANGGGYQ